MRIDCALHLLWTPTMPPATVLPTPGVVPPGWVPRPNADGGCESPPRVVVGVVVPEGAPRVCVPGVGAVGTAIGVAGEIRSKSPPVIGSLYFFRRNLCWTST